MLSREEILNQTDDGLRIILHCIPDAADAVGKKGATFKTGFRDEKTPSGTLWKSEKNGWMVKDWGEKSYSPFDLVMETERLDYPGAIRFIIQYFDLEVAGNVSERKYEYEKLNAGKPKSEKNGPEWNADEELGTKSQRFMEGYTINGMKTIFSKYVWEYMCGKAKTKEEGEANGLKTASKLCEKYGLKQLEWSSTVSTDKKTGEKVKHVYYATDNYPIYCWVVEHGTKTEPRTWLKFYEPFGKQRFSSFGPKPENYVFGEKQCLAAFEAIPNQEEIIEKLGLIPEDHEDDKDIFKALSLIWDKRQPRKKLSEIIIATGGSDALNCAALGYQVVWFNSESINKTDVPFEKLAGWAYKVINLPDIDVPGKTNALEMAFHWIDMCTCWLPAELRSMKSGKKDDEGKPKYCKDVKDYLARYTVKSFGELLKEAKPFKFWTATPRYEGDMPVMENGEVVYKYTPKPSILLNFLYHNGFGKLQSKSSDKIEFIRIIDGNIVTRIADTEVIKAFVDDFIKKHSRDGNLHDAFIRSKDISDSTFSRLPKLDIDFKDFDKDYQYMFFQNEVWVIYADKIEKIKPKSARKFVWEKEVVRPTYWCEKDAKRKHVEVDLLEDFFTITKTDDKHDIVVNEHNDLFFKYLINTSRIYWRTELEDNLDKSALTKEQKEAYRKAHQFDIAGPLLSDEEREQQKLNLIVKILTIGYMLHRYKRESNSKVVWSMDYLMRDVNKSQGGTGKSLTPRGIKEVMPTEYLSGRDKGVLDNKHVFENVSEFTDMLWLDDAGKDTNFDFFFGVVTGPMKKNPKGTKSETIDFEDSPKIWITSNFPPMKGDEDSTMRRIWFSAYSDFYHYNKSGEYRGEHKPEDDLGKQLFLDFDAKDWNTYLNFLAQCCKAYIKFGIVESNDQTLIANTFRNMIGPQFMDWANVYFNQEDQTLDYFLQKIQLHEIYELEVGEITANGFKTKLELWCRIKMYNFNPKKIEYGRQEDGRISAKQTHIPVFERREGKWEWKPLPKAMSREFIYIQSHPDNDINYEGMELYKPKKDDEPKTMPF